MIQRIIPSTGESLPVIGLGTWQTFDVPAPGENLQEVMTAFQQGGGRLLDSSPMYGGAEETIGRLTDGRDDFFYATKVWTTGKAEGIRQMEASFRKMRRSRMDLMQIHNLVDWETHLQTLREWKASGRIRYIGITHYTDAAQPELERIISTTDDIDFVQFNYSIFNRHAEQRLLDAAAHHGVATLINRPFGEGQLFRKVQDQPLPRWAGEHGISSWAQLFLKYIISHPAVTCIIPATANPLHAADNMLAMEGPVPDAAARKQLAAWAAAAG